MLTEEVLLILLFTITGEIYMARMKQNGYFIYIVGASVESHN